MPAPRISRLAALQTTARDVGKHGKLRIVLRSRKVVSRVVEFEMASSASTSLMTFNGQVFGTRKRVQIYDYVFEEEQARALHEAKDLAVRSGLALEVVDLTRLSLVRRLFRLGLSRAGRDDVAKLLAAPPAGPPGLEPTRSPVCRP